MDNLTQQQIDTLIQNINDATDPASVTNIMVANVLAFLAAKVETMATASDLSTEATARETVDASLNQSIQDEVTARQNAEIALSGRITSLQEAFNTMMNGNVEDAIESFNEVINFLSEVTDEETLTGLLTQINNRIASVENAKAGLDQYTGKLSYDQAPDVVLASMGSELDNVASSAGQWVEYSPRVGDTYWDKNSGHIKYVETSQFTRDLLGPKAGLIYCNKVTNLTYRWKGAQGWQQVGGSPGSTVEIANNLNTNDGTKALSAKQGKILKTNIETLNSNINALRSALANIAFTELPKPTMGELDWGGDRCAVTINNTLSGCRADKNGVQQVGEGNNLVITITANSGNLLRSVIASVGIVVIANNKASATVTISNVMSDMTVAIQANATEKGSFSASISDNRVSGTGALSGIVEGSAWESVLSLNNTAEEGAAITNVDVSMAGGGSISYNPLTNKVSTTYVTGDITITVTVAVVGKVTISFPLKSTGVVISSNNSVINDGVSQILVNEGSTVELLIAPDTSYSLQNVSATMGQQSITPTSNGDGTYTLSIANVTANVAVSATASLPATLTVNTKWCKIEDENGNEITGQTPITEGQPLTLIVKSLRKVAKDKDNLSTLIDDFIIAKAGYGNLYAYRNSSGAPGNVSDSGVVSIPGEGDTATVIKSVPPTSEVRAAVEVLGVTNPVITFYAAADGNNEANTCRIYIASVSGSITVNATGRLRMAMNASVSQGGNSYGRNSDVLRKNCAMLSGVYAQKESGQISYDWYHCMNYAYIKSYDSYACIVMKSRPTPEIVTQDGTVIQHYWGSSSTNDNHRATNYNDCDESYIYATFGMRCVFDDTLASKPKLTINGVDVVTTEDLRNAYYEWNNGEGRND